MRLKKQNTKDLAAASRPHYENARSPHKHTHTHTHTHTVKLNPGKKSNYIFILRRLRGVLSEQQIHFLIYFFVQPISHLLFFSSHQFFHR